MTLDELEMTMPNGLHDAMVRSVLIDWPARQLTLEADILVGLPEDGPADKSRLRSGRVVLDGLEFVSIEPPGPGSLRDQSAHNSARLRIDTFTPGSMPAAASELPHDCFVAGFFVSPWNARMLVAARDAKLEWVVA